MEPLDWEKRFHDMHSKKVLKESIQKRKKAQEKFSTSEGKNTSDYKFDNVNDELFKMN